RISNQTIEKLLVQHNLLSDDQIDTLKQESIRSHRSMQTLIEENNLIDEKELTQAFADYAHIPYVDLDPAAITQEDLNKIPERIARQYNAILFKVDEDGTPNLAMGDPDDVQAINFLQKELGSNVKIFI